ncbi:PTPA-CTERM sorting domain-containing protein [Thermoleptolyngbya oregonensis NK1-22]|uniref:PTPA-CTERM sorting domain-containing protein n=1 Tax=Thermoleptolyngbya oregonensis NK1-22 TaxID=2547457 RepID=A0AA97BD36_9CYAN|nr:PTPA-CTERM sorting domain-containing protein [Thermoleptolyngbya oregonensis]WOB43556.1 PTPA-CTERM sorting domain-containing protein [Thermoleptolyngbya oregonensis NK1-22]
MKLASTFALTAIAAAVSVLSALPAEALSMFRNIGPQFSQGLPPTGVIDFETPVPGIYNTFSEDYGNIIATGDRLRILPANSAADNYLRLRNLNGSNVTFTSDYKTWDSFGFLFRGRSGPDANMDIVFNLVGGGTFSTTLSTLLTLSGPGNYFSFVAGVGDPTIESVTFTRTSGYINIDNVAYRIVPTPALLPGIIGMGIAAIKKRRDGALEETEADAEA